MSATTRVTLLGAGRHVLVDLPADVPVGVLLPEIVALTGPELGDDPAAVALTPVGGTPLVPATTLAHAGVLDGALLTVTLSSDQPRTPVVYDVAGAVAVAPAEDPGWGGPQALGAVLTVAVVAALAAATAAFAALPLGAGAVLAVPGALLVVGAVQDQTRLGLGLPALAGAVAALAVAVLTLGAPAWLAPGPALVPLAWLAGRRRWRSVLVAAVGPAILGAGWLAALHLWTPPLAAAVAGVGTVFALGFAPRLGLSLSGLTALDDRAARQGSVEHRSVRTALGAAHEGLAVAVIAAAVSLAASGSALAAAAPRNPWALGLALALASVAALRARQFPLAVERAALLVVATASVLLLVGALAPGPVALLAASGAVLLAALGVLLVRLPEHTRAALRLTADRADALATWACVPLLLGLAGVFGQLATVFQR